MSSHRSKTKRKAMLWQGATLLLAAGAVGLLVLPIAAAWRPAQFDWDAPGTRLVSSAPLGTDGSNLSLAEAQSLGDILQRLLPPKPETPPIDPPAPPDDGGGEPLEVPTVPQQAPSASNKANWSYLGSAITPRASRALVRIDQTQKFVRQGTELDGVKLLEVHDDHIVIEEAGLQRRIDRAAMIASGMLEAPKNGAAAAKSGPPGAPPPVVPGPASAAAALAAAQAAHGKAKAGGPNTPGRLVARVMQLTPEQRQQLFVTMTSQQASYEDKLRAVSELGFDPEAELSERREAMRAVGLNPDDPDILRILEDEMNGAARDQR